MNFIGEMEDHAIQLELKYCERCGGLWLRPQGTDGVHCASCHLRLSAMPDPGEAQPRKRRARVKIRARVMDFEKETDRKVFPSGARVESLQGVAAAEVRA